MRGDVALPSRTVSVRHSVERTCTVCSSYMSKTKSGNCIMKNIGVPTIPTSS